MYKYIIFILIFPCMINFNKIKKYYHKTRWRYHEFKRKLLILRKKYFVQEYTIKKVLISILELMFLFCLILIFLKFTDVVKYESNHWIFDSSTLDIENHCYEFLWAQISASLIVSTIVSLLSVFSTSYVYGKKQINVIFNKNSIFSLGKLFIYLVLLIFASLIICLKKSNSYIILFSFIATIIIVCYMLFKIILFYTHPYFYNNCVKCDYIKRERKHIRKARPLEPHNDVEIQNLKEITMALIQKNDNDYNVNISAIMNMLETSLLSNCKELQEYYTESIFRSDFITSILEITAHLIKYGKYLEASGLMYQLFNRLKFFRIILVQDYLAHQNIISLINCGKYIGNEEEASVHFRKIWYIINFEIYFVYLYNNEIDLSYCRLGKLDMIYYWTYNDFLQRLYLSIKSNQYLSNEAKKNLYIELYDNIRMMEHKEEFPDPDIRHLWKNEINKNKIQIPLLIKGEPIVLMMLKFFESKDIDNIKLFKTMNVSNELMQYIISLITLSLIEFLHKKCVREYVNDIDMKKEEIIGIYKNTNFHRIMVNTEKLKELYKLFTKEYIDNNNGKRIYMLLPRLTLTINTINNYFYYLFKSINKEKEFKSIVNEFIPDTSILDIIYELKITKKTSKNNI